MNIRILFSFFRILAGTREARKVGGGCFITIQRNLTATLRKFNLRIFFAMLAWRLPLGQEESMKQYDHFRENADNCQRLAERASDHPTYLRYKRMEDAWLSLADEQDWLDGETPPAIIAVT